MIKSIKEAFGNKDIEITVSDEMDATEYLLSSEANKKHLYKSIEQFKNGEVISMTVAELQAKYLK
ncbi:MAG: hypothetical protein JST43_07955 [Bacteroidetes bacterium]|nr:hypothetical protein [Bacteroidota bacterium]MBS1539179.1 hypothetical protein [Bacteroidota bacterium]